MFDCDENEDRPMSLAPWHFRVQHFLLPKLGSSADECEDAIALNEAGGRFAVSDGATEAFDARNWAQLLASAWTRDEEATLTTEGFRRWVAARGDEFHEAWKNRALPWYAEEKSRAGSFAAFVGLQFLNVAGSLRWKSIALGDSCLFIVRNHQLQLAFPVSDPKKFNSFPLLVPSLVGQQQASLAQIELAEGASLAGDICWLLSDALAAWFLQRRLLGDAILREFESWLANSQRDKLSALLRDEQRAGRLRDDDYAAVRILIDGGSQNHAIRFDVP